MRTVVQASIVGAVLALAGLLILIGWPHHVRHSDRWALQASRFLGRWLIASGILTAVAPGLWRLNPRYPPLAFIAMTLIVVAISTWDAATTNGR